MRRTSFTLCFLSVLALNASAQETEKRPMTVDDGLNMVRVEDPMISPNGEWVLFDKSELDWKKNKRKSTHYRIAATGGDAFQYVGEAGGSAFQFSPKGTYLSFLRAVEAEDEEDKSEKAAEKEKQLFLMRTEGGEALQITKHKKGIHSYNWSEDESKIFFLADEPRSEEEAKKHKEGYDSIVVDEGPNGQMEGK